MSGSNIRVVLLGETGGGESSLCNTLFGEDVFGTDDSANYGTRKCEAKTGDVEGRSLTLIDTPGFFDTNTSEEQRKDEMLKCITECAPGPHAFLILLKVEKFSTQEKSIEKILQTFSEEVFKYAITVFTRGDQLPEGMKIEQFVQNNAGLRDLVSRCGGRCHVFDNRHWNQQDEYRSNQFHMAELLSTIEKMVEEHHGGCYTNEMLQQAEGMIQKMVKHNKQTMRGIQMSEEEIREQAKKEVYHTLKMSAGVTTGMLLGALLGVPMMVGMVMSSFRKALKEFGSPTLNHVAAEVAERVALGGPAARELVEAVVRAPREAAGGAGGGGAAAKTAAGGTGGGAKSSVFNQLLIRLAGITSAMVVGAVVGAGKAASQLLVERSPLSTQVIPTLASAALMGGVANLQLGYNAGKEAESPLEAVKKAFEGVVNK